MSVSLPPRALSELHRAFGGEVVTPADAAYDEARRLWNALHDRRPAVVARPRDAGEVATVVRFARDHDLEIAVRSGGHSLAGLPGADGGLVVDLSLMRGIEVDPERRIARANGGALLGELDVAAQAHGLVCPVGVVGHTGVAGLTLGGGVGRLQRHFGLTIDNLEAVELVTADGRLVRSTATDEPELFWGLRGAGWNFGIATAFEFRLHPFGPNLNRTILTYRAEDLQAVWAGFRAFADAAPESVSVIFGMGVAEAGGGYPDELVGRPIVFVGANHSGPADTAERDMAPLLAGPKPVSATIASQPYLDVQTAHDLVFAPGHRSSIHSANTDDLDIGVLEELLDRMTDAPGEGSFSVTALGGALRRVPEDAMAFTGRNARFDASADVFWTDPADDAAALAWGRSIVERAVPTPRLGRYANGHGDASPEETLLIYGAANVARLAALKRAWDPDNAFHVNHNVAPAASAEP